MKILAIGSHCDDVEIGCGGTLLKHRDDGDKICVAVLKSNEDLTAPHLTRKQEQKFSCGFLNASLLSFEYPLNVESCVEELDNYKPDILYLPYERDYHQDHHLASEVGFSVARRIQTTVLRYITPSSYDYYPNYLSVIDFDQKKKLVSLFKSQMERKPKFMEVMEAQNKYFGSLIPGDGHYAEGFMLHRMVKY